MTFLRARIKIRGTRPLLYNNMRLDAISPFRKEKSGVPGNNPEEWKDTYLATSSDQLYLKPDYLFSTIRAGAKHTKRGLGSLEPNVSATLQIIDDVILLNRYISVNSIDDDHSKDVYIDIRPVTRNKVKNIRYRLAVGTGWEAEFQIAWESTLVAREQMHSICIDAGLFAGIGDARKLGYGRFEICSFTVEEEIVNAQIKSS
ncbi:hypothetical protein [Gottfriedia acidiceleris]|uniref:hypothetical protein n=1 Tax=Gottfriedia acidiceleris TaxID=371036 RepID=UPI00101B8B9D|nr:hypothetical protein [Gottfriedia acidiceleris]